MRPVSPIPTAAERTRIRELFFSAGYFHEAVVKRINIPFDMISLMGWGGEPPHRWRADYRGHSGDRLGVLIRLFLMCETVSLDECRRVFDAAEFDFLSSMQLIESGKDGVASTCMFFEIEGLLVATDRPAAFGEIENPVMPLIPECYDLAVMRHRGSLNSALDLCTGSGVHALLLSRNSSQVVGVDNSPRAIAFAEFNRQLNEIGNVTFHRGDLYEPVFDRKFDLVMANPPYSPDASSAAGSNYYSGGKRGDEITKRILLDLDRHLTDGGICQLVHLIIVFGGQTYHQYLRDWLRDIELKFDIVADWTPIIYREEAPEDARQFYYGITHLRRGAALQGSYRERSLPDQIRMAGQPGAPAVFESHLRTSEGREAPANRTA